MMKFANRLTFADCHGLHRQRRSRLSARIHGLTTAEYNSKKRRASASRVAQLRGTTLSVLEHLVIDQRIQLPDELRNCGADLSAERSRPELDDGDSSSEDEQEESSHPDATMSDVTRSFLHH